MRHVTFYPIALALGLFVAASRCPGQVAKPADTDPIVEAGTVMGDFLRDFDWASKAYDTSVFTLRGRVEGVTSGKGGDGQSLAKIKVLPRDECPTMIPVVVDVAGAAADAAGKLKAGDLVEIGGVTYTEIPMPQIAHEITLFTGDTVKDLGPDPRIAARRDEITNWLKKNNAFGPNDAFVAAILKMTDKHMDSGEDFMISIGGGLMASQKATQLGMMDGKIFTLALTDAQARLRKIEATTLVDSGFAVSVTRVAVESAFEPPVFDGGAAWDVNKTLTGKVKIKTAIRPEYVPGDYALRMVSVTGGHRVALYSYGLKYAVEYPVSFKMEAADVNAVKAGPEAGPRVFVFEIVRNTKKDNGTVFEEVISEPQTIVLDVEAK